MTLTVADAYRDAFEAAELRTLDDVLARAPCIRDLPDRSNHELHLDDLHVYIKRKKPRRLRRLKASPEAEGIRKVAALGLPTATWVFEGIDRRHGAVVGTRTLAPRRPLDDVWRAGASYLATRAITFDLARQVAALHDARLHHRDLYLNHVFADPEQRPATCVLIDWERVGTHTGAFPHQVVKDLAALEMSSKRVGVPLAARRRFLLAYLSARGESPDVYLKHLLPRILAKAARMERHVPRTPVGDAARPPGAGA